MASSTWAISSSVCFWIWKAIACLRPAWADTTIYGILHRKYQRAFILDQVADLRQDLHRQLAEACLRWRALDDEARVYALCYLPTHLREARRWDALCDVLTDFDFLQA